MNIKLLHIGLGKTGSTTLQKEIFPEVSLHCNIKFFNQDVDHKKKSFSILENEWNFEKKLSNSFIFSNENLFSFDWEFIKVEKNFNLIKRNFSKDTIILLVLRNPSDLLNSIYTQRISQMEINSPENFFFVSEDTNLELNLNRYNLNNFDYKKIINLYQSYFNNVIVIKYENLQKLKSLKEVFKLDDNLIKKLQNKFDVKQHNKSISKNGINFILFLSKFLNLKKIDNNLRRRIKPDNNFFGKLKNIILKQFLIPEFFKEKFDKVIPYKKYEIRNDILPVNMKKLLEDYENLEERINLNYNEK